MPEVRLENVSKQFDNIIAVNNFNLLIKDKEFLVFVGPSGCGKTTTLRMVAGLETISSGEIYVGDRRVNNLHPKDRNIAMVFQDYSLYPHMTVFDNIAFGLKMRKTPLDTIKKGVKKVADILALEDLLKRKPKELSGGQRQRVALGRAIVRNPDVFLFDEPLSNLDAKLRIKTRVEIQRLHKKLMTTAIYVTHDQIEAMTMGDRIVVMDAGIIQQVGTPLDLYNRPANRFVGGFIGNPSMNFIDAEFERYGTELKLRIKNSILSLPPDIRKIIDQVGYSQKEVTIGIRPEHLECTNKDVPGETIPAIVEVIEPLGSETYLYVEMNGTQLTLKTAPNLSFEIQQKIILRPNINQFHLFDKSDGASLFSR